MNSSLRFLNFSPNSSKINTPLAESTAIGSPLAKQFQGISKRKSISPITNTNASKLRPGVKIDPHVLTDAQSNGIVSRLVKYYDQSNEPEKSRTVYSKFGDFPLVQLKKTELKRPIIRSTSVRIAPPNKTVMNPNLRAAIMRSSSFQLNSGLPKIAPTKMRAKDDSHKIITNHEPITDPNYPVSSKSVLDALEKNCRKRINNEELILDRSKKVCAPTIQEVVDSPKEFMPIPQSAKRNREEELSPDKNSYPRSILDSTNNQQSKRVKTRNNALLSSLSSSHYELPAIGSSFSNNNSRISSTVPPTPKVSTFKQKEVEIINEEVNKVKIVDTKPSEIKQEKEVEQPSKKLQLFNTRPDPNAATNRARLRALDDNADEDDDELKIRFVKPKEKVLENYEVINYVEKDKLNKMLKGLSQGIKSPVKDSQDKGKDTIDSKITSVSTEKQPIASISFTTSTTSSTIAPISTSVSTSNAVISNNPSSILSCLVSDKKDAESSAIKTSTIPSLISTSTALSVTTSSSSLTSTESTIPKPNIGGFSFGFTAPTTQTEIPKSTPSINPITSTSIVSPIIGIQSKPLSPLALFSNPKSDSAVDPNKSMISFTPIKPTENVQPSISLQSSTVTSSAPSLPVFGSAMSGGFKFGESAAPSNDKNSLPGFSFGSTTAQTEKVDPKTALVGFNFGGTTAQSSVTTSTPSFSFGSNQSIPKLPTASPLLPSTTSQTSNMTFQSPTTTSSASTNMFSFGGNTASPSFPGIQSSTPSFGQPAAQTTAVTGFGQSNAMGITSPLSSNAPSFNKPETTVASGVGFSFGSTNKPANSGFPFGSSNPTTTASSAFTGFGQSATTAQSTGIFSSAVVTTSAPSFSFNSSTVNSNNAPNSAFTGFNSVNPTVPKTEAPSMFTGFGQKPQTAPVTTNSTFGFGNTMNTATTALSAQPSQNSAFSFGQSGPTNNNENKQTGIFARLGDKQPENKPFSFGGSNTNNLQQQSSTFGTGNSSLGATASAPNIFGSPSSAPPSVFGQTPVLGSNNSTGNLFSSTNNQQATNSPFGSASSQNNNNNNQQQSGGNLFAFGSASSAPATNNNNANNQQSSGMFNFGGSNGNNNSNNNNSNTNQVNPLSSNNIFGSASNNNNSGQNVSASFTFNPATGNVSNSQQSAQPTSPFGQQSSAPPPYQFGQNAAIGNNVSTSFSFSGSSSAPVQTAQTPQSNTQMFNFGSSGTGAVPGSFNFQGQQQTALPPQPSPAGLFNIGTGGNQQRRPARVATRRYK